MTAKRFSLRYIDEEHISANIYDNETFIASISIGEELLVEVLNQLVEENEQLKESNERFSKTVAEQIIMIKEYREENEKLKEENQELTQKKNDLKDLLVNSEPVLEQKELQKIIFKMVYAAIDDKIKEAEEGFQQTYDSWYQGQIDALKELKKEFPYD